MLYDLRDIEQLQPRLKKLGKVPEQALLDALGAEVESQTRRRVAEEKTTPAGAPWAELDPDYAAWKSTVSDGGLLELTGDLISSLQYIVHSPLVIVGSNMVYANRQNTAREYLGLSSENIDDLDYLLADFMDDHVARSLQ